MSYSKQHIASALLITFLPLIGMASPLDTIKPGTWYEVPNSKMKDHAPEPLPPGHQSAVMRSWGGAAYDTKRDRLIVWGGGHRNYAGNEIYVFDIGSLKWSRITEPSRNVGGDRKSGIYPDGKPRSRHTYNYIEYMPNIDRLVSVGSAGTYPGGLSRDRKVYDFDFVKKNWRSDRAIAPKGGTVSSIALYDPLSGHLFRHSTMSHKGGLDEYDPAADLWIKHNRYYLRYYMTAALDAKRRKIIAVGGGKPTLMWDLNNLESTPVEISTKGDKYLKSTTAPGFVYDPVSDRYVGWSGGGDVFVFNPTNLKWTRVKPAQTNTIIPSVAQKNGTYGRFRYVASKDVFILVNSTTDNVYFYKLPKIQQ